MIELLAAVLLSSIIFTLLLGFSRSQLLALTTQRRRLEARQSAQTALDLMVREIRLAGLNPTGADLPRVSVARPQEIQFSSDLDGDGDADDAHEMIWYFYDPGMRVIRRATAGGVPQPLINNVPANGLRFAYFVADGSPIIPSGDPPALSPEERATVSHIRIFVAVDVKPSNRPMTVRMETSVSLRNTSRNDQ